MSGERLLASFIVRILVRGGQRIVRVHDVSSGTGMQFGTYRELVDLFERSEEQGEGPSAGKTSGAEGEGD